MNKSYQIINIDSKSPGGFANYRIVRALARCNSKFLTAFFQDMTWIENAVRGRRNVLSCIESLNLLPPRVGVFLCHIYRRVTSLAHVMPYLAPYTESLCPCPS